MVKKQYQTTPKSSAEEPKRGAGGWAQVRTCVSFVTSLNYQLKQQNYMKMKIENEIRWRASFLSFVLLFFFFFLTGSDLGQSSSGLDAMLGRLVHLFCYFLALGQLCDLFLSRNPSWLYQCSCFRINELLCFLQPENDKLYELDCPLDRYIYNFQKEIFLFD